MHGQNRPISSYTENFSSFSGFNLCNGLVLILYIFKLSQKATLQWLSISSKRYAIYAVSPTIFAI